MKRLIAVILAGLMLCGCTHTPGATGTAQTVQSEPTRIPSAENTLPASSVQPRTTEPGTTETEPAPPRARLSWAQAFRNKKAPEGSLGVDEVAFSIMNEDRSLTIENVAKAEIERFSAERERLPRTRFYEQFMDPEILSLLPILDYALEHGYSRFCVPTTEFHGGTVTANDHQLLRTFRINNAAISSLSVTTLRDGDLDYDFVLVSIQGVEAGEKRSTYAEGIAAAERIVEEMPEDLNEYEKILYLYRYLTDHVTYDYNEYYTGSWSLTYDALVKGKTVCAGYAEALYCLCNLAGIECITQVGIVAAGGAEGRHIWNEARIDGEWYLFDSTWDAGFRPQEYLFFGISDETMQSCSTRYVDAYDRELDPPCPKDLPHP